MSRIASKPVIIPSDVEVKIDGKVLNVKGPNGQSSHQLHPHVAVALSDAESGKVLNFSAENDSRQAMALTGTHRVLVNNLVIGLKEGFSKTLELKGVGYRVQIQGKKLNLTLGLSHPVVYVLPEGITVEAPNNTTIIIKGVNKQQVGQVAAEIRAKRPPEAYKGKGIRYADERIVLKETKKK